MKTFTQVSKFIIISFIVLFVYGCPVFKSITYPSTAFLGDKLTVQVNIDLMGITGAQNALLEIVLPDGWELTNDVIELEGLNNSMVTLTPNSSYGTSYWSAEISDQVTANNVLFDLEIRNKNTSASIDTFQISFGDGMIFKCDQQFTIKSISDENVPTEFIYRDDMLEWQIPKNNSAIKGYLISDNNDSWFTTNTKVSVDPGYELHRYSISAVTNSDQKYALGDTIVIFHGDSLYVSESGNDNNTGTETSPLKSLDLAMEYIDENYALSKDKCIRLLDGTYILDSTVKLRDRISLKGNGPQKSIISCTGEGIAISSQNQNIGLSLEDLSINALQNEAILDFSSYFFDEPEIKLKNVQLYNTDQTADGLRATSAKLVLDHTVIADMDSIGIMGLTIQVYNSVFAENYIGIFPTMSEIAYGTVRIVNSIFFENQKSISSYYPPSGIFNSVVIDNTIIETDWHSNGSGNFNDNPLFIDDPEYPFLLDPLSPAVDAGIDSVKYNDPVSTENELLAKFPARGTIRGDLGIYGGVVADFVSGLISYHMYEDLDIYPNPTDDILRVRWPNNKEPVNLWLTNASGTSLKLNYQNNQIDLSLLAPGFYFLFAEIDGKYYRSKIILR